MAKRNKGNKVISNVKKLNKITLLLVLLFCILGAGIGLGATYFLTKDDVFKINGET